MKFGENILNSCFEIGVKEQMTIKLKSQERPPRSENGDKVALKNTYLTDKLKFHKNTCSLNRLISTKCK